MNVWPIITSSFVTFGIVASSAVATTVLSEDIMETAGEAIASIALSLVAEAIILPLFRWLSKPSICSGKAMNAKDPIRDNARGNARIKSLGERMRNEAADALTGSVVDMSKEDDEEGSTLFDAIAGTTWFCQCLKKNEWGLYLVTRSSTCPSAKSWR